MIANVCFIAKIEPSNIQEALQDIQWIEAMQEELHQFEKIKSRNSHHDLKMLISLGKVDFQEQD